MEAIAPGRNTVLSFFFALLVLTSSSFVHPTAAIRLHAVRLSTHLTVATDDAVVVTKDIAAATKDIERQVPALDRQFNDLASKDGSVDDHKEMMSENNLASILQANYYIKEQSSVFYLPRRQMNSDCPSCVPPYIPPGSGGGGGIGNP